MRLLRKCLCGDSRPRLSGRAKLDNNVRVGTDAPVPPGELRATAVFVALVLPLSRPSACRLDMHVQPRENPLSQSDFFADGRSARPLVEGTVARGQLHADTYFYTDRIGDNPGDVRSEERRGG